MSIQPAENYFAVPVMPLDTNDLHWNQLAEIRRPSAIFDPDEGRCVSFQSDCPVAGADQASTVRGGGQPTRCEPKAGLARTEQTCDIVLDFKPLPPKFPRAAMLTSVAGMVKAFELAL